MPSHVDESFPDTLALELVPAMLAERKADYLAYQYPEHIVISADTVVILGQEIMNKPTDESEAEEMLKKLSGQKHVVVTGVCIISKGKKQVFSDHTNVFFRELTSNEISYYVQHYKPFDKAGAYGVQEWIGYVAVEKLEGSFYNVMGLPVSKVYEALKAIQGITI